MSRNLCTSLAIVFLSALVLSPASAAPGLAPAYLRCEARVDPLGIDERAPRLSWIVESGERGQRQTAYRLLVASTAELLQREQGDLWDSGKVASDETIGTIYQGRSLASQQPCFWSVKVWDKDGQESKWSKPAMWSMGLLQASDWKAEWIGFDQPRQKTLPEAPLSAAKWIWHAADGPGKAPPGQRLFLYSFTLPADAKIRQVEACASADDAMKFALNGHLRITSEAKGNSWRQARKAILTAEARPGTNELRVLVENSKRGDAGLIAELVVTLEDGRVLRFDTGDAWKSTAQTRDDWMKRPLKAAACAPVRVVGDYGAQPWGKLALNDIVLPPAVFLRREFTADKPVKRATLYATALGLVDIHLNGQRVSDDFFTPGWTDYKKRVYYRAYDVTKLLRQGANTVGAVLADGWFSGYIGYRGNRQLYGNAPRVRAQLHLEYADGTTGEVATGTEWKAATGPILEADFLKGEVYDARQELTGWDNPGTPVGTWRAVDVGSSEVQPVVQAHPGPPVRAIQEFTAKSIAEPKPGVYVLDLGQNFAGVPRLKVSGKPGQKITLRFAERLNPDGTIYTINLRSARATDTYICKGQGTEVWEPRFTFHGFQYIEITGLSAKPAPDTVVGIALSSDTPVAGAFSCSDPMLNQLHNNIYWTQRANFIEVPTDCPQRDERLGWTGDAQVYVRTATLNTDVEAFFAKWLVDLDDAQRADGQFPCVAPLVVAGDDGGPAWADAGVICPSTIYEVYGDRRVLERHYDSMKRFIEFCRNRSTPELLPPAKYHCYGDWLSIKASTPKEVIYTAYFAHCAKLTARAAGVLGKTADAKEYEALFKKIRAAFNRAYVAADGRIQGDSQACYALALAFDLVQGKKAQQAAQHLIEGIEQRDWHLSTGFIGTKYLMLVLSKIGRPDVAYRLLHNETFPSWGFSIKHGATSIWERWDGWTPEKGFQDPGMNSFAHYSFGAVYQWMVANIGGISSASTSFKNIRIAPQTDPLLKSASVSYRSVRGMIATEWTQKNGRFECKVTIPVNTTAQVVLRAKTPADVTESGRPLQSTQGVRFLRQEGPNVVLAVDSGHYTFSVQ